MQAGWVCIGAAVATNHESFYFVHLLFITKQYVSYVVLHFQSQCTYYYEPFSEPEEEEVLEEVEIEVDPVDESVRLCYHLPEETLQEIKNYKCHIENTLDHFKEKRKTFIRRKLPSLERLEVVK